jgi:hypothetical protein
MNIVVHKYLNAVYRVQRSVRVFLICKTGKLMGLTRLWDRMEKHFIKKKLGQQRKQMKNISKDIGIGLGLGLSSANTAASTAGAGASKAAGNGKSYHQHLTSFISSSRIPNIYQTKQVTEALIEIQLQAQNWQRIDDKMESMMVALRNSGVIEEKEEDTITKLMIPHDMKMVMLKLIIERARREYFTAQRQIIREKLRMDAVGRLFSRF